MVDWLPMGSRRHRRPRSRRRSDDDQPRPDGDPHPGRRPRRGTRGGGAGGPARIVASISPISRRLEPVLPRLPDAPARGGFPIAATTAPVVASLVLWAITRSPFALVFALLGPVIAVASLADTALQNRRRWKAAREDFGIAEEEAAAAIARFHADETAALAIAHPPSAEILRLGDADRGRWPAPVDAAGAGRPGSRLNVGLGAVPSSIIIDDGVLANPGGADEDLVLRRAALARSATTIPDAPIVVDAGGGIAVCGPIACALPVARSLVLQLARVLDPDDATIAAPRGNAWHWADGLPHGRPHESGPIEESAVVFFPVPNLARGTIPVGGIMVAVAPTRHQAPRRCALLLSVRPGGRATLVRVDGTETQLRVEPVSLEEATGFAALLDRAWQRESTATVLPSVLALSELVDRRPSREPGVTPGNATDGAVLACAIGRGAAGDWSVDLAVDGPHAVVGGTTGSGKSELLVSWAVALATRYPPETVTLLFVDFKGGASFDALRALPHCVGVVTDLDPPAALRALDSLAAEMRFRERMIATAEVRSIEQLDHGVLPRLVIFVDEFATMRSTLPELHELFADIAARGRSLGLHLVLGSQRPASALRDEILANCAIRLALRVIDRADSVAVVGSADAHDLPRRPAGRMVVSIDGGPVEHVQVARSSTEDVRRASTPTLRPVRRPWCDPLPAVVPLAELRALAAEGPEADAGVFGLLDLPSEQRRDDARHDQRRSIAVIGGGGSGRTSALRAIAATVEESVWVPDDPGAAWECLANEAVRLPDPSGRWRLVVLDDLDALLGRFPPEYQADVVDLLARIARDGPRRSISVALSARGVPSSLGAVLAACEERLVLRLPSRHEHAAAGGEARQFDPRLPPGGGHWHGARVQVGWTDAQTLSVDDTAVARPPVFDVSDGVVAMVSTSPTEMCRRLLASSATVVEVGPGTTLPGMTPAGAMLPAPSPGVPVAAVVLLGDPEAWQSAWSLAVAVRHRVPIVFDRCTLADYRAITGVRSLPPPLAVAGGECWLVSPGEPVRRIRLPGGAHLGSKDSAPK